MRNLINYNNYFKNIILNDEDLNEKLQKGQILNVHNLL